MTTRCWLTCQRAKTNSCSNMMTILMSTLKSEKCSTTSFHPSCSTNQMMCLSIRKSTSTHSIQLLSRTSHLSSLVPLVWANALSLIWCSKSMATFSRGREVTPLDPSEERMRRLWKTTSLSLKMNSRTWSLKMPSLRVDSDLMEVGMELPTLSYRESRIMGRSPSLKWMCRVQLKSTNKLWKATSYSSTLHHLKS